MAREIGEAFWTRKASKKKMARLDQYIGKILLARLPYHPGSLTPFCKKESVRPKPLATRKRLTP
jgi:hypothetical protein